MENIVVGSINVFSNVVVAAWTRHQVAERAATRAWVAARGLLVDTAGNGCGMRGHRHVCVCVCVAGSRKTMVGLSKRSHLVPP